MKKRRQNLKIIFKKAGKLKREKVSLSKIWAARTSELFSSLQWGGGSECPPNSYIIYIYRTYICGTHSPQELVPLSIHGPHISRRPKADWPKGVRGAEPHNKIQDQSVPKLC